MSQVAEDTKKIKAFIERSITAMNKGHYVYLCNGYSGDSSGGKYDNVIQDNSNLILNKFLSLGYTYTTNHGHGCKDWKFSKKIELD